MVHRLGTSLSLFRLLDLGTDNRIMHTIKQAKVNREVRVDSRLRCHLSTIHRNNHNCESFYPLEIQNVDYMVMKRISPLL